VTKKKLSVVGPHEEGLGLPTVMDRALAQKWGIPYVHLAVFAIDVDRVREAIEEADETLWPFGGEVLLLVRYIHANLDPEHHVELVEEACQHAMDRSREGMVLGAQMPFALYVLMARGDWPDASKSIFGAWSQEPKDLLESLADIEAEPDGLTELIDLTLRLELDPPLSPPTEEALLALASRRS
jgi:hypothetical protein